VRAKSPVDTALPHGHKRASRPERFAPGINDMTPGSGALSEVAGTPAQTP
jgi:hypothetical protein